MAKIYKHRHFKNLREMTQFMNDNNIDPADVITVFQESETVYWVVFRGEE